jgi:hypothetical protein
MSRLMDQVEDMAPSSHAEGGLARPIEEFTAGLPSDTFLWLAGASIVGSMTLKMMGRAHDALFVGQWAPTFLLLGTYNKLVKQLGHDKYDRH